MIRELFTWGWRFVWAVISFHWSHLDYHWKNLWWYLKYGFSYSDIMDTDLYIMERLNSMLKQYRVYHVGFPANSSEKRFNKALDKMIELSDLVASGATESMDPEEAAQIKRRLNYYLQHYYYALWF